MKRTKKEQKEIAQRELMFAMQLAFSKVGLSDQDRSEMDKQFMRVEKLFNYEPGSWVRGC